MQNILILDNHYLMGWIILLEKKDEVILTITGTWCLASCSKWIHSTKERSTYKYYWKMIFLMQFKGHECYFGRFNRFRICPIYALYLCKINLGQAQKCVWSTFQSQRIQDANLSKIIWTLENEGRWRHCNLFSLNRWNCEHHKGSRTKYW